MMKTLFKNALLKADQIRMDLGINMFDPVNIFDVCAKLEVAVRFIDISMEGMYFKPKGSGQASILLSNQRPLPRRNYTCAHELGHHIFGHGTKLDLLSEQIGQPNFYNDEELLVDSFAGALLMPVAGIEAAFTKRKMLVEKASPIDFFKISSTFGVGYHTLIHHCKTNKLISDPCASNLLKATPAKIFKSLFPFLTSNSHFKIIDKNAKLSVIDLEVTNYIVLPPDVFIEGNHLQKMQTTSAGIVCLATKPGVVRVATSDGKLSCFVRIQNFQYIGLAENRHLENTIE